MPFLIAMLIVVIACIAITYKITVGYSDFSWPVKSAVMVLLLFAWFGPFLLRLLDKYNLLPGNTYAVAAKISYFLMGAAFVLVMLLILREVIWYAVYYISRNQALNPDNVALINRNNLITLVVALGLSFWGVYEANKTPALKEIDITDQRIKADTRLVIASDFHIDRATPLWQIRQIVEKINEQNPDYILLVGDIIDDEPENLKEKMEELKNLKAKKIFLSFGNHEFYNAPVKWMIEFTHMGFEVLNNTGTPIEESGIYVGGIPDAGVSDPNFAKVLYWATPEHYKILMSHSPFVIKNLEKGQFDLQVSGHTHGGQIFPFHFLAKAANGYLAGMYDVNDTKLYITRGAGYWGPPMRILAPSDISVINLKAPAND